jgi:SAM-dependent methyltransferase
MTQEHTGSVKSAAAVGFDKEAESYNRYRPSYPSAAIDVLRDHLGLEAGALVGDLAAGTGISTRQLLGAGYRVIALEPVAGMRRQLAAAMPSGSQASIAATTAEQLALRDGALDALVGYQAFHWFDMQLALREIARVVRPGGGVVMVWNARDQSSDWIAQWTHIVHSMSDGQPYNDYRSHDWRAVFAANGSFSPLHYELVDNPQLTTPTAVIERTRNTSFVGALPPERQQPLLDAVQTLLDTHLDVAGRSEFTMPNQTHIWSTRRL